jgi:membrane-bound serine protease (ClpP class)
MESYLAVSLLLIALGVVLLIGEFFFPITGGLLVVAGITLFAVAVGVIVYWGTRTEAIIATIGLSVGLPAAFAGLFQAWKQFSLKTGLDPEGAGGTLIAAMPELSELERLKGRYGRTVTPMRPSGSVEIDGRRVDALSEGVMIDAGAWVRCVDVKGSRVTVRQVDAPADLGNINLDDMT